MAESSLFPLALECYLLGSVTCLVAVGRISQVNGTDLIRPSGGSLFLVCRVDLVSRSSFPHVDYLTLSIHQVETVGFVIMEVLF